ncbi:hypothetical protein KUCAC02_030641 [Chaenocephalus aceratus]|uniref:Uncharacterized protein n=1 Tax=Chaenocephalus aceratus TaxID=36190 RepID=A0ACB9XJC2_CHAAC|nr:hypothetical protein KUCAC02_030641 [Chaenocephalus aceratus]
MQAARLRSLSPMNTARGLEPRGTRRASGAYGRTPLTTSIGDIIAIFLDSVGLAQFHCLNTGYLVAEHLTDCPRKTPEIR